MTYKLIPDHMGNSGVTLIKVEQGFVLTIPPVEGNRHYEEYLKWVAEGNEAIVSEAIE